MPHDIKKYLHDIITSINSINDFLGHQRDFKRYEADKMLRRAVERELEIIGESMSQLLKIKPDIQISDARKIVDTRNLVIHGYDLVDNTIIWGIVINYLPKLKGEVEALMNEDL
jgi:uncharacterized protein with HEPN domain